MEKLIPFFMAAIFVAVTFGLLRLALSVSGRLTRQKILSAKTVTADAAVAYLCSVFGMKNVLSRVILPVETPVGRRFARIDAVVLLPTGLAVLELIDLSGHVENRDALVWHQSTVTRSGGPGESDFENPFTQNERHLRAVRETLGKTVSIPLTGLVVFTSPRVSFSEKRADVYTLTEAVEALRGLSARGKKLSAEERAKALSVLSSAARKGGAEWREKQKKR